jgi:hypothetical protein
MATGPDDVRFQGKTGSSRPTTKMTRLTQSRTRTPLRSGRRRIAKRHSDRNSLGMQETYDEEMVRINVAELI